MLPNGGSDCLDGEDCRGGFCAGGSCPCEEGWECVVDPGIILDNKYCALSCSTHADCPPTWGCHFDNRCSYPRRVEVTIEGPTEASMGGTATYIAQVEAVGEELTYQWSVNGGAEITSANDGPSIDVRFANSWTATVILSVKDELNVSPGTAVLDVALRQEP